MDRVADTFDQDVPMHLRGTLLLADPALRGNIFARSVVLITGHSPTNGAHGYILNRPAEQTVGDLLPQDDYVSLSSVPVFVGGPVSQETLTFAALWWGHTENQLLWADHLSRTEALDHLARGVHVRAFVGYSGWEEGQLEGEFRRQSWISRSTIIEILTTPCSDLWRFLMASISPWHYLLSMTPDDPSLN
jgi:putative transcriptional regulator